MDRQLRKLVAVGDGGVGKTSLLIVLVRGEFSDVSVSSSIFNMYAHSMFENYIVDVDVKGELVELALWDTPGQGDCEDRLRSLRVYPGAHAFLICFSIVCPDSLDNVLEKWDTEIKHFGAGKVPRFLVGCKKDLRHDPVTLSELSQSSQVPVMTDQGKNMAKAIGAEYFECSSKTGEDVRELFARVTESMDADRVAQYKYKRRSYHRPWYRSGGCIVV